MIWKVVDKGKYRGKGKTLPQIVFDDPDWFFFNFEEGRFAQWDSELGRQAKLIEKRARNIKIPKKNPELYEVEYIVDSMSGKFASIQIVDKDRPDHVGSSITERKKVIDLRFPRTWKSYDKLGGKILVKSLKYLLFGSQSARLTKQRCEDFFDDLNNFVV